MAIHFHPLTVKEIIRQTSDCVSVTFAIPDHLQETFRFVQGQNITIKTTIDGEDTRRSYSISTAPHENKLAVAIRKVPGGKFSTYANEFLKSGDVLEVMPPVGKFNTACNAAHQKRYTAFAAGSGITPILSIIKHTLHAEPHSEFTLVYANRNRAAIIFFDELEALKNKYLQRFNLINLLSREKTDADIFSGRLNTEKLAQLGKLIAYKSQDEFFVCGPEEMIFCIKDFLTATGIAAEKIHFELFTTAGINKKAAAAISTANEQITSSIEIKLDGRTVDFNMGINSGSILDEALKQGADLPFACKGGVCCTCKAKLLEGEVEMDVNWGLEHDEIAQGFILTCQSHPRTDRVVIDFDVR